MPVNQICQQDCIEGMQSLKEETVDLVFADPPFNIGYNYDVYDDHHSPEEYLNWSENWLREVYRILKPNGTLWLAIGDDFAAELKILLTHKIGMFCRNWIIWYYTFGVHCQKKFTRSHTHLFYMVKNANRFTFNDSEIRVPSARQTIYHDKRASSKGRIPDDTWVLRPQEIPNGFDGEQSVWYFARLRNF